MNLPLQSWRSGLNLRDRLLSLNRTQKRLLQLAADVAIIWLALWLALYLRVGNMRLSSPLAAMPGCLLWHRWLPCLFSLPKVFTGR
ncbi:MAG: hypothetical protein WC982_04235 [Advenella sp.]